jgi:hypothetical protein
MAGASKKACLFLDELTKELVKDEKTAILHKHFSSDGKTLSGKEHRIPNTRFHVDGYLTKTECSSSLAFDLGEKGLVIEFHGHLWHGYPDESRHEEMTFYGARVGDLYDQTMERMETIKAQGYSVVYVWEDDYSHWKNTNSKDTLLSICNVV